MPNKWFYSLTLAAFLLVGCTRHGAPLGTTAGVARVDQSQLFSIGDLEMRMLEPGVWLITHLVPWPANSLLVEMGTGDLVLVDTPYTPAATDRLLTWIEQILGERNVTAINTHFHWDALGGNRALMKRGIVVHGSDATVELLAQREESMREQVVGWLKKRPNDAEPFHALHAAAPDQIFPLVRGTTLRFAGERVDVVYPGHTHSPDGVVVYFPDRKLLYGGCSVVAGKSLGNKTDADLTAWLNAMQRLKEFDVHRVVPGHGVSTLPELINHTIGLLKALNQSQF